MRISPGVYLKKLTSSTGSSSTRPLGKFSGVLSRLSSGFFFQKFTLVVFWKALIAIVRILNDLVRGNVHRYKVYRLFQIPKVMTIDLFAVNP